MLSYINNKCMLLGYYQINNYIVNKRSERLEMYFNDYFLVYSESLSFI